MPNNLIGQTIDHYQITAKLGAGGMAVVYKAYDTRLERDVALKVIGIDMVQPALLPQMLKRFEREAKTQAQLQHTNIVKVHDFGEYQGAPYLVMEYLPGGTLKERLGLPISAAQAAQLLAPVARALAYAHQQGLIHRDVKPANILLTANDQPLLSDFGIVRTIDAGDSTGLTGTGVGIGTPEYMAPEQWTGKAGPSSDIYSLGVVLYEMTTGRRPFTASTPGEALLKHATEPLPDPRQHAPNMPQVVVDVLYRALAKQPQNRFASMGAFAQALEALVLNLASAQGGDNHGIVQPGPFAPRQDGMTAPQTISPKILPLVEPERVRAGLSRWVWVGTGLAILICLGVGALGVYLAQSSGDGVSATQTAFAVTLAAVKSPVPVAVKPTAEKPVAVSSETEKPIQITETTSPTETPRPVELAGPTKAPLGIGSTKISSRDGMKMVYVPAGEFQMGSENGEKDEKPVHTVYLNAYWMDKTEVTNAMFTLFVQQTGYQTDAEKKGSSFVYESGGHWVEVSGTDWRHPNGPASNLNDLADHPVMQVSRADSVSYCNWAGRELPTEAQWEKAARGTDGRKYPWGNQAPAGDLLNYSDVNLGDADWADNNVNDGYQFTAPVGSYPNGASPYGALDMAGNVWEWLADWYGEGYYAQSPREGPRGPDTGDRYTMRGGSWANNVDGVRSSYRGWGIPGARRAASSGFRCVVATE